MMELLMDPAFILTSPLIVFFLYFFIIYDHFQRWEKPKEQRIIVVLLLIPPIQALVSYLHFALPQYITDGIPFIILDSIKECYTALIFPLFLTLLYTYLELNDETLSSIYVRVIIGQRYITNFFPVTLIQPECVSINLENLKFFEYSAWQYVVIRVVCSVLMILFQHLGMCPVWLSCVFFVITNVSFLSAFYTVYVFYQAFLDTFRLRVRRRYFFFCLIVFGCFFQGAVIRIVSETGIIQANLEDVLLIAEMMFFSLPTRLAFHPCDYALVLPVVQPVDANSRCWEDIIGDWIFKS